MQERAGPRDALPTKALAIRDSLLRRESTFPDEQPTDAPMRTAKCVERAGTKYFRIHGAKRTRRLSYARECCGCVCTRLACEMCDRNARYNRLGLYRTSSAASSGPSESDLG